jgi:hypothetical protein
MKDLQTAKSGRINISNVNIRGYIYSEDEKICRLSVIGKDKKTEIVLDDIVNIVMGDFVNEMVYEGIYVWPVRETVYFNDDIQNEAWSTLLSYYTINTEDMKKMAINITNKAPDFLLVYFRNAYNNGIAAICRDLNFK